MHQVGAGGAQLQGVFGLMNAAGDDGQAVPPAFAQAAHRATYRVERGQTTQPAAAVALDRIDDHAADAVGDSGLDNRVFNVWRNGQQPRTVGNDLRIGDHQHIGEWCELVRRFVVADADEQRHRQFAPAQQPLAHRRGAGVGRRVGIPTRLLIHSAFYCSLDTGCSDRADLDETDAEARQCPERRAIHIEIAGQADGAETPDPQKGSLQALIRPHVAEEVDHQRAPR